VTKSSYPGNRAESIRGREKKRDGNMRQREFLALGNEVEPN